MNDAENRTPDAEPSIIDGDTARRLIDEAVVARLGDRWDDEETGWAVVAGHDYMLRLTRGNVNLDFYVDLLGNVTVEERTISGGQEHGRVMAWLILGGSLLIAFLLAWLSGYL